MSGERPSAADPDLHPYPSPPLSTPSKGPPAALLARPLGGLPSALNLSGPPPAVLDTLRLPLLSKVSHRSRLAGSRLKFPGGGTFV